MKNLLILLSFVAVSIHYNSAFAQQKKSEHDDLKGAMELIIDVSTMKDTVGRFSISIGTERFYPKINNNTFTITTVLQEPQRAFIHFYPAQKISENPNKPLSEIATGASDYLDFLAVPGITKIFVNVNVANSKIINASPYQKDYFELLEKKDKNFNIMMMEDHADLIAELEDGKYQQDKDSIMAIFSQYYAENYSKYYQETILEFIKSNPDSPASLFELEEYSISNNKDLKTLMALYNQLSDRLKALPAAGRIDRRIDNKSFAAYKLLGQSALDFTQNDPSDKAVSLKDFKGKVTLLVFWTSWCGPCRMANPGLLQAYNKYNSNGFEILGVSLDDDKESWLKAIKDDGLTWTQVSELTGFKNSAAELYHVYSVPTNYLIDSSGKIIATHLDIEELNEHLENLLE